MQEKTKKNKWLLKCRNVAKTGACVGQLGFVHIIFLDSSNFLPLDPGTRNLIRYVYGILVQLYNHRSPILLEFIEFLDNSARLTLNEILT